MRPFISYAVTVTSEEPSTRPQIGTALTLIPLGIIGGGAAAAFQESKFFADSGYWNTLSGWQQLAYCGVAIAVILLVTFGFPSWRRDFWRPIGSAIAKRVRWLRRWRLIQKPIEDTRRSITPTARIVGPVTRSGDVIVGRNLDGTKSISWRNGFQIGILRPASGNRWEVIYGHRVLREFEQKVNLGYATTEREAIKMLKEKDNEEASESQRG